MLTVAAVPQPLCLDLEANLSRLHSASLNDPDDVKFYGQLRRWMVWMEKVSRVGEQILSERRVHGVSLLLLSSRFS